MSAEAEVKVEEEEQEKTEEMPPLEPAEGKEDVGEDGEEKGKQSRAEKKSRKAIAKLGLKPAPEVLRVTVKKGKSILFVINNPDVFKSPANETTWVIFGEAKVEDSTGAALSKQAQQFAQAASSEAKGDDLPDLVETAPAETEGEAVDADGVPENLIKLVVEQAACSRGEAIEALKKTNNDVVNSIMEITMGGNK